MGALQPLVHIRLDPEAVRDALTQAWLARFGREPSPRSINLLLAHIALETGMSECRNWNLGNVKATVGGDADWCVFRTWEVENGIKVPQDAAFRSFPNIGAGADFYLGFLFHRFAKAWPSVIAGEPGMFAVCLKSQGYYTAPLEDYASGMRGLFAKYWTHLAQSLLCAAGYAVAIDGILGPATSSALAHFQADAGLPNTGHADDATIGALHAAPAPPDTLPEVA